ncbi:MAG: aminotransferase class I/II-fold pyridoxal phosphate-dependent enzyme, partial [Desulfobacterales bacterium]|nr:aminotransferase class I/II-fold pyridoxal phosphate-dependent enzyme [Desulfobacterales bacterium]
MDLEFHLKQLYTIASPEHRAAYYCQYIDTDAIDLSTAENVLLFDFYKETLFNPDVRGPVDESVIRYPGEIYGSDAFRESIALLLGESWGINNLDKDDVFTVSGVSAALECLAFALFRKGDGAILPAPLWYGFPWSLVDRPEMNFYPFSIEKQGAETAFELTLEDIRRAYNDTTPSPRVLILTNPGNPLVTNYPEKLLDEIFHWVLNCTDMHIISDEIYGFSQVDTGKEKVPFKSAFSLDAYTKATPDQQERVHLV